MFPRLTIAAAVMLLAAACSPSSPAISSPDMQNITIGTTKLSVEIADSNSERERGLSHREKLPDNQGMLFDFSNTDITRPSFWMKDMNFAIDIIWVKDNRVIGIVTAPAPSVYDELVIYTPPGPVDTVIEVNADWAHQHGIKVGDEIKTETPR